MSKLKEFDHLKVQMEDIISATDNFNEDKLIGRGGFGPVYKGELSLSTGKTMVAFKRLDRRLGQGNIEFWKEILMLSICKHENLVSLLHFSIEGEDRVLVYEYASRGSLDRYISDASLTWNQRLHICIGVAHALKYLHDPMQKQRVLHLDIKSSNILLDENWSPKVSDFGLSKFGPSNHKQTYLVSKVVGTFGYYDPLYWEMGFLSKESDVYSFGVVLFEVMCGRLCYEYGNGELTGILVKKWKKCYDEKKLDDIIFQDLKEQIVWDSLITFSAIANRCINRDRGDRPTMDKIVEELEFALAQQMKYNHELLKISKLAVPRLSYNSENELISLMSKGIVVDDGKRWVLLNENKEILEMISATHCFDGPSYEYGTNKDSRKMTDIKVLHLSQLKEVTNDTNDFTIKVRILRIWKRTDQNNPNVIFSLEMVIMDEEGTKTQARIRNEYMSRFERVLMEDGVFYIQHPTVAKFVSKLPVSELEDKIMFFNKTKVKKTDSFSGSVHGFSFKGFDSIMSETDSSKRTIDVIGEVVKLYQIVEPKSKLAQKRFDIVIKDLSGLQLKASLWGKLADQFSDFNATNKDVRVIIIFQFAWVNVYNGRSSVSTYYDLTRIFINSNIPEINEFRRRLIEATGEEEKPSGLTMHSDPPFSERDYFLNKFAFKNIIEVLDPVEENSFILMGTVTGIRQNLPWYYQACTNCSRSAQLKDDEDNKEDKTAGVANTKIYFCTNVNCKNRKISVKPRYKIPIVLQDSTGTIVLSLFDREAFRFLNVSASYCLNKIKELGLSDEFFPEELNVLKGLKLCLKIDIKGFNVKYNKSYYTISRVSTDDYIMNELEKKNVVEEKSFSGNFEDGSLDNKSAKDCVSHTGENVTPIDLEKSSATSPAKFNQIRFQNKRNFDTIFDVDEDEIGSTSKKNPHSQSKISELNLKIPKLEK